MISILSSKSLTLHFSFLFFLFAAWHCEPSICLAPTEASSRFPKGLQFTCTPCHKHHTAYLLRTFTGWQAALVKSSTGSALLPKAACIWPCGLPASNPIHSSAPQFSKGLLAAHTPHVPPLSSPLVAPVPPGGCPFFPPATC